MSAILSADDLNDFISPGVACIKPVETLPAAAAAPPFDPSNPYEVTTEDKITPVDQLQAAQISLTDCLACSGCVTSAEAVLVSLQSHNEVLSILDQEDARMQDDAMETECEFPRPRTKRKVFVASVSAQTRASLAAALKTTTKVVGNMIDHLLLEEVGKDGKKAFDYVLDITPMLSICLHLAAKEVVESTQHGAGTVKRPILTSECPGFICYLEKTHPAVLPHLSKLKSPQAVLGTLLKSLLPKSYDEDVEIYHVTIMPCFDKKLEASRAELTDVAWKDEVGSTTARDVDCVITTRELLQLAAAREVDFIALPRTPFHQQPFTNSALQAIFASDSRLLTLPRSPSSGTSGGYLLHILQSLQSLHPNSTITEKKGRVSDVYEYALVDNSTNTEIIKMARYYGFRNIQNLIRRISPKQRVLPGGRKLGGSKKAAAVEFAYIEVMACPGGCTNGGGQLKSEDRMITTESADVMVPSDELGILQANKLKGKEWLAKVDEAYYSSDEGDVTPTEQTMGDFIEGFLEYWSRETGVQVEKLVETTYRAVESDVGKAKNTNGELSTVQVAELAGRAGGGW